MNETAKERTKRLQGKSMYDIIKESHLVKKPDNLGDKE